MRFYRYIARILILSMLGMSLMVPAAQAGLIGTADVAQAGERAETRTQLKDMLQRDDVAKELRSLGVEPGEVQARVDNLTDEEVQMLSQKMNDLPAGGNVLGVIVFIFLVLLITDILGFTDVYPFVKKRAR